MQALLRTLNSLISADRAFGSAGWCHSVRLRRGGHSRLPMRRSRCMSYLHRLGRMATCTDSFRISGFFSGSDGMVNCRSFCDSTLGYFGGFAYWSWTCRRCGPC